MLCSNRLEQVAKDVMCMFSSRSELYTSKLTSVVCATRANVNTPVRLRSYPSKFDPSTGCTIWQAARATSAAPLYFKPITFGKPEQVYVDGGLHCNNPVRVLYDEAKNVWNTSSGRTIDCIISIGTGSLSLIPVRKRVDELLRTVVRMATDTEDTAQQFCNEINNMPSTERPAYFRFNVDKGLETIALEEWKHFSTLAEATNDYLNGNRELVDSCVEALLSVAGT